MEKKRKILIIEDEEAIRRIFRYYLEDRNFEVVAASDGTEGIEKFHSEKPDVVLTDLRMPRAGGMEVLKAVISVSDEIPVIVISGVNSIEDAVLALRQGAWDYLVKPIQDLSLLEYTVKRCIEKSDLLKENRIYREHLEDLVRERTMELELKNKQLDNSRRQLIGVLSQAAEYKDFETGNHFLRVSEISAVIARGLGWDDDSVSMLALASPVHDIGKIGIPDNILLKPGKLTDDEWCTMKEHCIYGKNILMSHKFVQTFCGEEKESDPETSVESGCSLIHTASKIAMSHHEHWDGNGYPNGLKGESIPIEGRITAVADVFDALHSRRPYKEPWDTDESINYIRENSGKQFDPDVVRAFLDNVEEIKSILKSHSD